tara:strand:+ start:1477 stop:2067 length:591 start_codon:yes stop_codon:yes gene_type:complete
MSENNSKITTYPKEKEKQTGMPPSVSGAENLSVWLKKNRRPVPILNPPEFLIITLTEYDLTLIDTMARVTSEKLDELKPTYEVVELKKKLASVIISLETAMKPASNESIVKSLQVLGDTFQTELPKAEGLKYYIEAIKDIPPVLLKEAIVNVMKTHKYNTFPLPAVIREAIANKLDFCYSFYHWCKTAYSRVASIV